MWSLINVSNNLHTTDVKLEKMKAVSGEEVHAFSQATYKKQSFKKKTHTTRKHSSEKGQLAYECNSADKSMSDCVRNAHHGVKSVSRANQRIILPASAENHREGKHNIMFTNYKMTLIQKTRS